MSLEKRRKSVVKLYSRYLKQQRIMFFFLIFFNLLMLGGVIYFVLIVWTPTSELGAKLTKQWMKILCTIPAGLIEIFCLWKLYKSYKFDRSLKEERQNFRGILPENPTNSIKTLYLRSHIFKNNFYWIVFAVIGLLIITIIYSLIAAGILKALGTLEPELFKSSTWDSFNLKNFFKDGTTAAISGSVLALPVVFLSYFFFTFKSSRIVFNFEAMYGKEKIIDITYLEFKTHKNNKRNKLYVFILLCILGFVIYIFFKKIILAVFNKSFH